MKQIRPLYLTLLVLWLAACGNGKDPHQPAPDVKVTVKEPADINRLLKEALSQFWSEVTADSVTVLHTDTVLTLRYFDSIRSKTELLFLNKGRLNALGDSLWQLITTARQYGLYPETYHASTVKALRSQWFDSTKKEYNITALLRTEVLLTDAYLLLGAHLNKGRFLNDSVLSLWQPARLDSHWTDTLALGLKTTQLKKALAALEPKHKGYHFLKTAFQKFVHETDSLVWDSVGSTTISDTIAWKAAIKTQLTAQGYYNDSLPLTDSLKLAKAIKRFQVFHNLEPDGKLGKYTKQALSLSKEGLIRQMEMALEHWRWEPTRFPERYAFINIPSADMYVWEYDKKQKEDTLVMMSRVVVGKPDTQTPLLKSKINFIQIYPYWSVPYSIAWKEILPVVQRDTSYLRRKNFEVVNSKGEVIDIKKINFRKFSRDYLPVKFRQRIGSDNSLGICKFNFPNTYGVYLHDTNSKRYFKTFYRYQSHGCIRLEQFKDLARFLIREDTLKIPYDTLNVYFERQEQKRIDVRKPLSIYVRYYTARADSALNLQVFLDIYRKDERMAKLLYR